MADACSGAWGGGSRQHEGEAVRGNPRVQQAAGLCASCSSVHPPTRLPWQAGRCPGAAAQRSGVPAGQTRRPGGLGRSRCRRWSRARRSWCCPCPQSPQTSWRACPGRGWRKSSCEVVVGGGGGQRAAASVASAAAGARVGSGQHAPPSPACPALPRLPARTHPKSLTAPCSGIVVLRSSERRKVGCVSRDWMRKPKVRRPEAATPSTCAPQQTSRAASRRPKAMRNAMLLADCSPLDWTTGKGRGAQTGLVGRGRAEGAASRRRRRRRWCLWRARGPVLGRTSCIHSGTGEQGATGEQAARAPAILTALAAGCSDPRHLLLVRGSLQGEAGQGAGTRQGAGGECWVASAESRPFVAALPSGALEAQAGGVIQRVLC